MRISDICFEQLKRFEGLRNEAYYDPAGVLTIGYGHTGPDVRPGDVISKYWAEHLLKADLYDVEKAVDELKVAVTQPQFDALVSFAFTEDLDAAEDDTQWRLDARDQGGVQEVGVCRRPETEGARAAQGVGSPTVL